jgi:hypothetical protein
MVSKGNKNLLKIAKTGDFELKEQRGMCFNVVELKVVDGKPMHTYPNQPL